MRQVGRLEWVGMDEETAEGVWGIECSTSASPVFTFGARVARVDARLRVPRLTGAGTGGTKSFILAIIALDEYPLAALLSSSVMYLVAPSPFSGRRARTALVEMSPGSVGGFGCGSDPLVEGASPVPTQGRLVATECFNFGNLRLFGFGAAG